MIFLRYKWKFVKDYMRQDYNESLPGKEEKSEQLRKVRKEIM